MLTTVNDGSTKFPGTGSFIIINNRKTEVKYVIRFRKIRQLTERRHEWQF